MKHIKKIFLLVIAVLLVLPLLTFNFKKDSVSSIDNRKLTELTINSGDKTEMLNSYVKDRIGFRSSSIDFYTKLNDMLFGEMVHPTYTYGRDGYVFFKLNAEKADIEFIEIFCSYLRRVQDYCKARNVPFLYCINPSKTTVYNRYLPKGYTYRNDFLEKLYESLETYQINYISNVELLSEKSLSEQVFNVKYDAGHWNDLGCLYGTNHMLEELHKYFPSVTSHKWEDFTRKEVLEESLLASHFKIYENVPYYENQAEQNVKDRSNAFDTVRVDKNYRGFGVYLNSNAGSEKLPNVLFFHGSYYNSRVRFYDTSFREAYRIHNYQNFINFDYYFNLFKPECVILETAEYATTRDYFDIEGLKNKTFNLPYDLTKEQDHVSYQLDNVEYQIGTVNAISVITANMEVPYRNGYLLVDGEEYDLQISGTEINCTVQTSVLSEESLKDASIKLFD